jgi:two-component sensor histidine kinase
MRRLEMHHAIENRLQISSSLTVMKSPIHGSQGLEWERFIANSTRLHARVKVVMIEKGGDMS